MSTTDLETLLKVQAKGDMAGQSTNPFLRYRSMLYPYRIAISQGMSDNDYTKLVTNLDKRIQEVNGGTGFTMTPMFFAADLNTLIKDESNNVAGSHKARHLFNVMVYLLVLDALKPESSLRTDRRLAVASCGNAGLAAATIAAAANWPIDVCIPEHAEQAIVSNLQSLGDSVNIVKCSTDKKSVYIESMQKHVSTTDAADPTVSVFSNLVQNHGSIPFSVQGNECGLAVEGAQTIAWEILEQAGELDDSKKLDFSSLFVQVGGGALGSGIIQGFQRAVNHADKLSQVIPSLDIVNSSSVPALVTVQAEGNAPLRRAFNKLKEHKTTLKQASQMRADYMYPWDNPTSIAHGILDDETYDWVELVKGMESTNGDAIVVNEDIIQKANEYAKSKFKIDSCFTGSVGLAGLMSTSAKNVDGSPAICILSGKDRSSQK